MNSRSNSSLVWVCPAVKGKTLKPCCAGPRMAVQPGQTSIGSSIGKQGKFLNRAIWRRLGFARDRVFEVSITDPVKAVIISANLKAEAGES
jgi:hypothetical protein